MPCLQDALSRASGTTAWKGRPTCRLSAAHLRKTGRRPAARATASPAVPAACGHGWIADRCSPSSASSRRIARLGEPVLDHLGRHFHVELQPVGRFPVAERLVPALLAVCQMDRARRQIERVAVPLEDGHRLGATAQQPIDGGRRGQVQAIPADFLAAGWRTRASPGPWPGVAPQGRCRARGNSASTACRIQATSGARNG